MATIIKSVSFENFYNYYGSFEHNQYDFSNGINIINADNNMGKSKFYNGFMWLLEDRVYDSDIKAFVDANDSLERMASGKAKSEKTDFKVGVKVVFENEAIEYTIEKYALFSKVGDELTHSSSKLLINKYEDFGDTPILDQDEQKRIINKVFLPFALRPYALLQGESMDRIVDLSSKTALSNTIDTLAGISILKGICDIAKRIAKKADALYKQKDLDNSKNDKAKILDTQRRDQNSQRLEVLNEQLENAEIEIDAARGHKEQLDAYISNSKKRNDIRARLVNVNNEIESKQQKIDRIHTSITKRIFDDENPWLLMGLEDELNYFQKMREKYVGELAVLNNEGALIIMLPEGSPDVSSLKRMLDNEICEVCGQPAARHSEAWEHIKMILDRPQKISTARNDFGQFYGSLEKSASAYSMSIPRIDSKMQQVYDELDDTNDELKNLKESKEEILTELSNAGGDSDNSHKEDDLLIGSYDKIVTTINQREGDIDKLNNQITLIKSVIQKLDEQLKKYVKNEETERYKDFAGLLAKIEAVINETKDSIFDRTIKSLEAEANRLYVQLTEGNQSSGGKLLFKKDHDIVNVSIRDVNNGEITGLGTGFQRMKQLAIVMAIISSKIGGQKKFDYPFISDAPFSEFGENFINNFFNVAPGVFTQSIIMIKELYDPKSKDYLTPFGRIILDKMLKGDIQGSFYVNVIEEKADTTGLVTTHKCYKK